MQEAFKLAQEARGKTLPNPAVGAVIVRDGQIVGQGRTQAAGQDHAEVQALKDAGEAARGGDMYVTLEPCCHYGRTPPCTSAILEAGIRRVVAAVKDPNPLVAGGGFQVLREQGLIVEVEGLDGLVEEFYQPFRTWVLRKRPFVEVKLAQSLDGFIAGPHKERVQISSADASHWMHQFRARVDAVAVGGSTVMQDNPHLTARLEGAQNPLRVVVFNEPELPRESHVLDAKEAHTLLYSANPMDYAGGQEQVLVGNQPFELVWDEVLQDLGQRGIHHMLVESGTRFLAGIMESGLWDRFYLLTGAVFLERGYGWRENMPRKWSDSLRLSKFEAVGKDFLTVFENFSAR